MEALLAEHGCTSADFRIRTGAGLKQLRLIEHAGLHFTFELNMGEPELREPRHSLRLNGGARDVTHETRRHLGIEDHRHLAGLDAPGPEATEGAAGRGLPDLLGSVEALALAGGVIPAVALHLAILRGHG